MKKHIYLFLLSILFTVAQLKAQNLVAYYKLDGNAIVTFGTTNGTTAGVVLADTNRFNVQNSAMRFGNSFSSASIPNSFDLPQKTINFWLYIDTVISNVNVLTIDNATLNHGMVYLQLNRVLSTNKLQFFGGNATILEVNVQRKQWHKISITYANSVYKLFLNNKIVGSVTSSNVHSLDGYQGLVLGNNRAFNNMNPLKGKIDDLSIYNYAMDSTQLANITQVACDYTNIINVYDTTNVTVFDTSIVTVTDTSYLTITDTAYVTIQDTNLITITDTVYLSVYDTLIVDILSSVFQTRINTIKIYPNPTKDFLNINNGNFSAITNYQYVITNASGATVFTHIVNGAQTIIDINTWPQGIYFLNIYDASSKLVEVKKIIIN
jgi:hypothetical protein